MLNHRCYPANYFDPEELPMYVQCQKCGEFFDGNDIDNVEYVPDIFGDVLQGICTECENEPGESE